MKKQQKLKNLENDSNWRRENIWTDKVVGLCDVIISPTTPFAFTMRKATNAKATSTEEAYNTKLNKFIAMGIQITDKVFERNHTIPGVHCHGVMQIPKKFNMKKFRCRGWHIHLDEINNMEAWRTYIAKEAVIRLKDEEQISPDTPIENQEFDPAKLRNLFRK